MRSLPADSGSRGLGGASAATAGPRLVLDAAGFLLFGVDSPAAFVGAGFLAVPDALVAATVVASADTAGVDDGVSAGGFPAAVFLDRGAFSATFFSSAGFGVEAGVGSAGRFFGDIEINQLLCVIRRRIGCSVAAMRTRETTALSPARPAGPHVDRLMNQ
jgi:hypothetical protein